MSERTEGIVDSALRIGGSLLAALANFLGLRFCGVSDNLAITAAFLVASVWMVVLFSLSTIMRELWDEPDR
jgi:hypothetical protein